jgi:hypothetical protein
VAGFHVLAQDAGGFGALTEGLLAHVRDAYPRAPVVRACAQGLCARACARNGERKSAAGGVSLR